MIADNLCTVYITGLLLLCNIIDSSQQRNLFQQLVLQETSNIYPYSLLVCRIRNFTVTNVKSVLCNQWYGISITYGELLYIYSWLRYCTTTRKAASSIPDGVTGIFHWHNPSGRTMALGLTQPLTESELPLIDIFPLAGGGGGTPVRGVENPTPYSCKRC